MFNTVFFIGYYGIKIYIFYAFKNIAFNLRVDFAHLANHIFNFLAL